jgi:hypothetical protein
MSLAREPSLHLFQNQLGLHFGQQRPALREGQAQLGKTAVTALNHGQNSVTVIDRGAIAGSAGGISPPAAHRTVRKPLDLHGSSQPFFGHLAMTDRRGR